MKKKVLCTALAVTMMLTTTASATAKPWWLSKYRVTFDNELGIVGNVTLTFASDGGNFIIPITNRYGESISLESYVPTKYGYTFKGWFTDPRTKQNQVRTFKFTKPDVLYAKWEKNPEEPINPNDEIMAKDTCYLTDEETKIRNEIIEEKLYNKANKTRLSKVVNKPPEKAEFDNFLRTHSECPICSSPIKRQNQCYGENRSVAYKCTNSVCPAKSVKENRLVNLITELLNKIADDLSLADESVITAIPDDELTDDMANDIYIKMLTEYDKDEVLADIYELAKIKFRNSIKTDMSAVTERIKKELCKYGIITEPHFPLMQKIISKFYVGGKDELSILLTNGKLVTRSVN